MSYHERPPSVDLAPYVRCLWDLETSGAALSQPIFPDGCIEVVVHRGERPRQAGSSSLQPAVLVVGQMLEATRLESTARIHAVGVRFTPAGARAWIGLPLHEVTGRIEDAHAVCGRAADRLRSAIEGGGTREDRFAGVEAALRATLRPGACHGTIAHAVAAIERRGGVVTVDALARACGFSARQLERRFRDAVGLPPKPFARIVRFQRALRELRAGAPPAGVAAACGFADQAHLAREFRRVAGMPARRVSLPDVAFVQDTHAPGHGHW